MRRNLFGKFALVLIAVIAAGFFFATQVDQASASHGGPTVVTDPATGHSYQYFAGPVNWDTAKNNAANLTHNGVAGHLATITSAAETAYILANKSDAVAARAWIGATQPTGSTEPAGGWEWVNGEVFDYDPWVSGEPNEYLNGNENAVHFANAAGDWNDLNGGSTKGYLVEFDSVEVLDLDSALHFTGGAPAPGYALSLGVLEGGVDYSVTIVGNWNAWGGPLTEACKDDILYTSPTSPGGTDASHDAEYLYRFATSPGCTNATAQDLVHYSLDGGGTFVTLPAPEIAGYNPAHKYTYVITGDDDQVAFKLTDNGGNFGVMKVTIEPIPTAQSATFLGGVGSVGDVMDGTDASFVSSSGPWVPAYLARHTNGTPHSWGLVTGTTEWISACKTLDFATACIGVVPEDGTDEDFPAIDDVIIWYRIQFDVPADWFSASMRFRTRVDNAVTYSLNGTTIGSRFVGIQILRMISPSPWLTGP